MKFLKTSRVCIVTRGRYAGKKVVIIQPFDNGSKAHPFGYAVVAGIERYPSKVTRRMGKSRQEKRSKIKPYVSLLLNTQANWMETTTHITRHSYAGRVVSRADLVIFY